MSNEYLMLTFIYDLLLSKEAERLGVISTETYKEYVINARDSQRTVLDFLKLYAMDKDFERTGSK